MPRIFNNAFKLWNRKLAARILFRTDDGRVFFYPFGPVKSYIVPNPAFERLIIKSIAWFSLSSCVVVAFAFAFVLIFVAFKFRSPVLLIVCLLEFVRHVLWIHRLTRKLVSLPFALSVRSYASLKDAQELWTRFYGFFLMAILCGFFAVFGPLDAIGWIAFGLFASLASLFGFVLRLKRLDQTTSGPGPYRKLD